MQVAATKPPSGVVLQEPGAPTISALSRRRIFEDWGFILPQLFFFIVLNIIPLFVAIPILFTDMSQFNDPLVNYVGFRNFTALFTDRAVQEDYLPAFQRTDRKSVV